MKFERNPIFEAHLIQMKPDYHLKLWLNMLDMQILKLLKIGIN